MVCPKGHGEMHKYEDGLMKERYVCTQCDLKLDFDTATGKAVQVGGVMTVALGGLAVLLKVLARHHDPT